MDLLGDGVFDERFFAVDEPSPGWTVLDSWQSDTAQRSQCRILQVPVM